MSDSYKKPRNGNDKRYDGNRKPYHSTQIPNPQFINPQYRANENKGNYKDRRKSGPRKFNEGDNLGGQIGKLIPGINDLLEKIAENQTALIQIGGQLAAAEEKKAEAMSTIADSLSRFVETGITPAPETTVSRPPDKPEPANREMSEKDKAVDMIVGLRKEGMSYRQIARRLEEAKIKTLSGKGRWHHQTVQKLGKLHFPENLI